MATHELKTWPEYFTQVWRGRKTFELRRDDRGFKAGDLLLLREYDMERDDLPAGARFTGRELTAEVLYLLAGGQLGLKAGYVVMAIKVMQRASASARLPKVV